MTQSTVKSVLLDRLDRHFGILAIIPAACCIVLFFAYPMVTNVGLSFTDSKLISKTTEFVGLTNYHRVLSDPRVWNALKNGMIYAVGSVVGQAVVGFCAALMLFYVRSDRTSKTYRNLLLIPWATPFISSIFIWRWILHDLYGLLNLMLSKLNLISEPISWLGQPTLAMASCITMTIWFGVPLMMTTILAAMQSIPTPQIDSAVLEGARTRHMIRYVIFPNVRGVIGVTATLRTIWVFNNFGTIYAMTGGGPLRATETLPIIAYQTAWVRYLLGRSGALCVFMTFWLVILVAIYFRALRLRKAVSA